jgi:hypothetical protein
MKNKERSIISGQASPLIMDPQRNKVMQLDI